jgi:hypothetical protein
MYDNRLYGYLLKSYGKHKGIGVVANKEVGRYYRPGHEDEDRVVRQGTIFAIEKWNIPRPKDHEGKWDPFRENEDSFVMTFNSSSYIDN